MLLISIRSLVEQLQQMRSLRKVMVNRALTRVGLKEKERVNKRDQRGLMRETIVKPGCPTILVREVLVQKM